MKNYNTIIYLKTKTTVLDKIAILLFVVLLTMASLCVLV